MARKNKGKPVINTAIAPAKKAPQATPTPEPKATENKVSEPIYPDPHY